MEKVTKEQGDALLVAINKLSCGLTFLAVGHEKRGKELVQEAQVALQQLGVPLEIS